MKDFTARTIIGIALCLLALLVILPPTRVPLLIAAILVSSLSIYELCRAFEDKRISLNMGLLLGFNFLLMFFSYYRDIRNYLLCWVFFLLFRFIIFIMDANEDFKSLFIGLLPALYISFFSSFILWMPVNKKYLFFLFSCSAGTDTAAYLIGNKFGKTPLSSVSPNKTLEGAIGGLVASILCCLLVQLLFFRQASVWRVILLGFFGSILAQLGDLFASRLKRELDVKDWGKVFGPHGGMLDRFDSSIFITPFVWMFSRLI